MLDHRVWPEIGKKGNFFKKPFLKFPTVPKVARNFLRKLTILVNTFKERLNYARSSVKGVPPKIQLNLKLDWIFVWDTLISKGFSKISYNVLRLYLSAFWRKILDVKSGYSYLLLLCEHTAVAERWKIMKRENFACYWNYLTLWGPIVLALC